MPMPLEALQAEAMRHAPAGKARLLERLILSLDVEAEAEAAWDAVADAREAEVAAGTVAAVPLHEALGRLEGRFRG